MTSVRFASDKGLEGELEVAIRAVELAAQLTCKVQADLASWSHATKADKSPVTGMALFFLNGLYKKI